MSNEGNYNSLSNTFLDNHTNDFTKRIWLSPGVILELSPTHGSHGYGESDARHDEKGQDVFPDSIFPQ